MDDLKRWVDDPASRASVRVADVVDACLARSHEIQPIVNAFVTTTDERARADATHVDQLLKTGRHLPLAGMTLAIKDNMDVAGVPTTAASRAFAGRIPSEDSEVVRRLRAAGAVVIAKSNMHELAYGVTTANPAPFGTCRNPWDLARTAGGSSGGSAVAVAVDAAIGALGSDTGGSVRIPAALTGVTGIRPTYGRISTRGVIPLSWTLDTVGPIARSAADVARMFRVLAGYDPRDVHSAVGRRESDSRASRDPMRGLVVGVPIQYFFDDVDPEIDLAVRRAADTLETLGASTVPLDVPVDHSYWSSPALIVRAEAYAVHRAQLRREPHLFGPDFRNRLKIAQRVRGWQVGAAMEHHCRWLREAQSLLDRVDVIICPSTRVPAPPLDGLDPIAAGAELTSLMYPWSFAHVPALSMPAGLDSHGLPIGVQLVAGSWRDELLLRVAQAFQAATRWHLARPALPIS
jgi:aspartyl-tRNA(Asn)/glutamyl-tRNA(Gln) amidotransferase subunit A